MNKRGYLQISFSWLFAIVVGLFILFLAIFVISKLMNSQQTTQDVTISKGLGILLNPLETSFESTKVTEITLPSESRIYATCDNFGEFGTQFIKLSQKSFNKWSNTNINVGFKNKYIFSEEFVEGKTFYVFSKTFDPVFKIADLIYIIPANKKYCFINAPENIKKEIDLIGLDNLLTENCEENSVKICFDNSNCEIKVNYNQGYVQRSEGKIYFADDSLMYAAIFSNKENYECESKRLMQRLSNLLEIYEEKANLVSLQGCNSNLDLESLKNLADAFDSSSDYLQIFVNGLDLKEKSNDARCKLW